MRISDWSSDVCSSDLFAYTGYRQCICPWFATVGMFDLPAADRVAGGALASGHGLSPYGDSSVSDPAGSGQAVWRWRSVDDRSEEHTSELQSLMRISYAVFCLQKKKIRETNNTSTCR